MLPIIGLQTSYFVPIMSVIGGEGLARFTADYKAFINAMCAIGFRVVNDIPNQAIILVHPEDDLDQQTRGLYMRIPGQDELSCPEMDYITNKLKELYGWTTATFVEFDEGYNDSVVMQFATWDDVDSL